MDKREFLKASGALLAGSMLAPLGYSDEKSQPRTNWSGNFEYHAAHLDVPASAQSVSAVVKKAGKFKTLGSRHSFNSIADTTGDQISSQNFGGMEIDSKAKTVTVGAGVKYGQLAPYLDSHGFALHNLASLPHITIAGACSTGTHGSGSRNGNLSTAASGLEFITASGETIHLSRAKDGEHFAGACVGLGALGVITRVTLDLLPTFTMRQVVYENLPFAQLETHLEQIFAGGYSVSLFTDWQNSRATQVWIKSRVEPGHASPVATEFYGAKAATRNLHPLAGHSAENCTDQMGVPGPWYKRMPHFKMNFTPSSGAELQTEYFVPRDRAYLAIRAVEKLRDHITPHLFITEFRTIAADKLWMSPAYERDSMAIHFTWKPEWAAVKPILPLIEKQLAPFDARPHWAKLFTMDPAHLQSLYPKLADFRNLVRGYDPDGKFHNAFLSTNVLSV